MTQRSVVREPSAFIERLSDEAAEQLFDELTEQRHASAQLSDKRRRDLLAWADRVPAAVRLAACASPWLDASSLTERIARTPAAVLELDRCGCAVAAATERAAFDHGSATAQRACLVLLV